jgi:hypothetical protein
VESYIDHELGVRLRRRTNSPSEVTWFGFWNYLEFETAEPAAEFAPNPPTMATLNAVVDATGITSAEQEAKCHWLTPTDFDRW